MRLCKQLVRSKRSSQRHYIDLRIINTYLHTADAKHRLNQLELGEL